jgi:phosphomannomutase
MIHNIKRYYGTGEINLHIDKKEEAMEALREGFCSAEEPLVLYDFDGYRIEFREWWFNVRPSNTEPYLRFLAEARSQELLEIKKAKAFDILQPFITKDFHAH